MRVTTPLNAELAGERNLKPCGPANCSDMTGMGNSAPVSVLRVFGNGETTRYPPHMVEMQNLTEAVY